MEPFPNLETIFAIKVKRLRKRSGLTLSDLARSAGLDGDFDELQSFLTAPVIRDCPFEFFGVPAVDSTLRCVRCLS